MNLTESEWRTIHNALSVYQSTFVTRIRAHLERNTARRAELQQLMDKIRDNYIAGREDRPKQLGVHQWMKLRRANKKGVPHSLRVKPQ